MRVLVVGSGGREHALVWKIAQSDRVKEIFAAPGNGGTGTLAKNVNIGPDDVDGLRDLAKREKIDLTVVGPEVPLVGGIVDAFREDGLRVFGPDSRTAKLEGSKVFAKELMREFGVPTADFKVFDNKDKALSFIKEKGAPIVIKADGLAAGKGVFVCMTQKEAGDAIEEIMVKKAFGASGDRVIVEECISGEEASIIAVSDGEYAVPLASSQDHKRIYDHDKGPNTGGMGAYSPAPVAGGGRLEEAMSRIIYPVIRGLKKKGLPYKGVLYAGVMIKGSEMYVLEFNVRFGDPETQAILPRMKSDIVDLMEASIDGKLKEFKTKWDKRPCVCVVASSGGYPGPYKKEKEIKGLNEAEKLKDVFIFHAGTRREKERCLTSGGRVLGITALGDDIENAIKISYEAAGMIHFDGMHYRKDIGRRALCLGNQSSR
ncbi:MAG: phosphoribosylamine--glycine ligase [Candidatus Omnitrophota bacterium]